MSNQTSYFKLQLFVSILAPLACSPRQQATYDKPKLGSQTRTNPSNPNQSPFGNSENPLTASDSCGQEGGSCAPIQFSVSYAGTYFEVTGVKFWLATKGVPVDWQVRISDVPDRPVVASLKLNGANFEPAGTAEGMTTYKVKYTPRSAEDSQAEVQIRDVKKCLSLTKNTNLCNSASGSLDSRYDTKAVIAYRVESTQSQQSNLPFQIFSCTLKTIGTVAGGQAAEVTNAISQGMGANGCN